MRWSHSARWIGIVLVLVLGTSVFTGCSLFKKQSSEIDPPAVDYTVMAQEEVLDSAKQLATADQMTITLYMRDRMGMLAPVSLAIGKEEGIARRTLEYMVDGGPASALLPAGFRGVLPQGTKVLGVNITPEKLAIIDFSKEIFQYNAQDERMLLEAVAWTMTEFANVQKVQLWVEGKLLKDMPLEGTPLDQPLSRAMGINLERSSEVDFGQATPVTLYFMNQTEGYSYYVPVTRLAKRSDDPGKAALEQLIAGPHVKSGLLSAVPQGVSILNLKLSDDHKLATANFSKELLGPDLMVSNEAMQSLILSISENTGATEVQIMIGGDAKITATDMKQYSTPVTRPIKINQYKL